MAGWDCLGPRKPYKFVEDLDVDNVDLSFEKLNYECAVGVSWTNTKTKRIINNISGRVTAGHAMALIGPSGAGKSTLLDVLAGRKTTGQITGNVWLNSKPLDKELFLSISAYIPQDDVMLGGLTVYETLMFSAQLRLPDGTTKEGLNQRVDEVIGELGLAKARNNQIGTEMRRGISGGEKKRVSIGTELVTQPAIVFLDEPTTGLDSTTAINLMHMLVALASRQRAVVYSIHQPSSFMWTQLEYLLVLTHQGTQAYFGKAGDAVAYFNSHGAICDQHLNPAEFMIDVVSAQHATDLGDFNLQDLVEKGQENTMKAIKELSPKDVESGGTGSATEKSGLLSPRSRHKRPAASCFTQYKVILWRFTLSQIRDPTDFFVQLTVSVCFACLIGSIYYQIPLTEAGIQDRSGGLFFMMMNAGFSNLGSLNVFLQERHLFVRERASGMYKTLPFFVGKTLPDIPKYVVSGLIFCTMAYTLMGLNPAPGRFSWFLAIMFILTNISYALCLMVSSFAPSFTVANMIAPLLIMLLMLPSGFLVNTTSLPWFWKWLYHVSFFHYGYEALIVNEFDGLKFQPKERGITGGAVIKRLDMSVKNFHFDVEVLISFWFIFMIVAYMCLNLLQKERR